MSRSQWMRELQDQGWTIIRANAHIIWRHPDASSLLTTAFSPSDRRAEQNIMSMAKRLLKAKA